MLDINNYGELGIIDTLEEFAVPRTIHQRTYVIGFDPQGNAEAPFEQRCADWAKFEARYFRYDEVTQKRL